MKKQTMIILLFVGMGSLLFTSCKTTQTEGKVPAIEKPLNGEVVIKWESGAVWSKGVYKNNEKEGRFTVYYQTGKKQYEEMFSNGIKNGKYISYFENGNKEEEGKYLNDLKHGEWLTYSSSGSVIDKSTYNKGVKV